MCEERTCDDWGKATMVNLIERVEIPIPREHVTDPLASEPRPLRLAVADPRRLIAEARSLAIGGEPAFEVVATMWGEIAPQEIADSEPDLGVPWLAGGHPQCHSSAGGGQAAGDGQQSAAQRASGRNGRVGQADQGGPAQQVVRQGGDQPRTTRAPKTGGSRLRSIRGQRADRLRRHPLSWRLVDRMFE
jgi:hypothetical protein